MKRARGAARGFVWAIAAFCLLATAEMTFGADRATEICRNPGDTRGALNAASVATKLGSLTGYARHKALGCLEPRVAADLSGNDLARVVGDGIDYRERMICSLRSHVRESLSAGDAAAAMGGLAGIRRYFSLTCLEPKLAHRLTDRDVDLIVGDGLTHRGKMIAAIETKTVEGMNAAVLSEYKNRFPSRQFLGEGDPPDWLNGQCIAWTRKLYAKVSERSLDGIAFGAARNIPAVLRGRGFEVIADPARPRVGAMAVWDEGAAGHVGVVVNVTRNLQTGVITEVTISEANFGRVTTSGARKWGLTYEEAKQEFVTERYGIFGEAKFPVTSLDRGLFRFVGYVYP